MWIGLYASWCHLYSRTVQLAAAIHATLSPAAAAAAAASELIRQLILSVGRSQREHYPGFFPGDRRRSDLAIVTICLVDFRTCFGLNGGASLPGSSAIRYADTTIRRSSVSRWRTCRCTDVIVVVIVDTHSYGITVFAVLALLPSVRRTIGVHCRSLGV